MGFIFQNISKKYGAVVAIKHAEMEIENGEVRAILGGNGSGKSTLAKALGGLISKNSGEIIFDGQSIDFKSPKEAKKKSCNNDKPGTESVRKSDGRRKYLHM